MGLSSSVKEANPWKAYQKGLKAQALVSRAYMLVPLVATLVLGLTVYFTMLGRNHMYDVLMADARSNVSATCHASRNLIDVEQLVTFNQPSDTKLQPDYEHTMVNLQNLCYSVGANRIYVIKQVGTGYQIIWDTEHNNALAFTEVTLDDVQREAFTGTISLFVHAPGDKYADVNSGALPLFYQGQNIAIVCVDFTTQSVNDAYNTTTIIMYLLIGSMTLMMIALFVASFLLIRQSQKNQQQLFDMANSDITTGLPNRRFLFSYLAEHIDDPLSPHHNSSLVALFYDLDDFKAVNDSAGHEVGDQLLYIIGQFLSQSLNTIAQISHRECLTARLGGDEFVQLLADTDLVEIKAYIDQLLDDFLQAAQLQEFIDDYGVSLSVGIAAYPEHTTNANDLVKYADIAMYHSKSRGKHSYTVYQPSMGDFVEGITLSVREQKKNRL